MPTFDLLTGAAVWHDQIRTPDGSAPRNATTEAAGLQDLTDCVTFLKQHGPDRIGTVASMVSRDAPAEGDVFFTLENGQYRFTYTSPGVGPFPDPFVKPSGTVAGWWISALWAQLFGSSNPAKISQALIPTPSYPRMVSVGSGTCTAFTQSITTSTYFQVNDGTNDLSANIVCAAGDRVRISIGPITGHTTASATSLLAEALIVDGAANVEYPMTLVENNSIIDAVGYLNFEHLVTTGPISMYLRAKASIGGAGSVSFSAYGPTGSQWIRLEVIR